MYKFLAGISIVAGFCWVSLPQMSAQNDSSNLQIGAYYFDGHYVVFEFDRREYAKAYNRLDSMLVEFADLDILQVAVSGNFNNWSEEGWRMEQVDSVTFRLRKKIKHFKDVFGWQFRFVINGIYVTPEQISIQKAGLLGRYDIQNPNLPELFPVDTGNVLFRLEGFQDREMVVLSGSFNNWDEHRLTMKKRNGGWELRLPLPPGEYLYKFIADGEWMHDPKNPDVKINQYDTFNSVLQVARPVRFFLAGFQDAQTVYLAGTFNNWKPYDIRMTKTGAGWMVETSLLKGKHMYKFIVDDVWITDPQNRVQETTWDGYTNSVIMVR